MNKTIENGIETDNTELPFEYVRVYDPEEAQFECWRQNPVKLDGVENLPRTDEEILADVKQEQESKEWFTSEYWREKGIPEEQVEIVINGHPITIYNYNKDKKLSDEHIIGATQSLMLLSLKFPIVLERLRWMLIGDIQPESLLGDENSYPTNGIALPKNRAIQLMPRGMELFPHRIKEVSNFEGTIVHEVGHLFEQLFHREWDEVAQWRMCFMNPEDWVGKKMANGMPKWFHRRTGEMSLQGEYVLNPERCITNYARQNMSEDICDSLVAYIYCRRRLKEIASEKDAILNAHDEKIEQAPVISARRIAKEAIRLPVVKKQVINYYIEEPESAFH